MAKDKQYTLVSVKTGERLGNLYDSRQEAAEALARFKAIYPMRAKVALFGAAPKRKKTRVKPKTLAQRLRAHAARKVR